MLKNIAYYYMYGTHPVISAIQNPRRKIIKIFCTNRIFDSYHNLITQHNHEVVDDKILTKIVKQDINHQGIVAKLTSIFQSTIPLNLLSKTKSRVAILDQVTDPQNIGSIIRSAAAFSIDALIMQQKHAPDENATIAKVATGTLELLDIIKVVNLQHAITKLKENNFWILGLDGNTSTYLNNTMFSDKTAIILGSEDKGLRNIVAKQCDYIGRIPISNQVESLNVTQAATISFYLSSLKN